MAHLEEVIRGASVNGVLPNRIVSMLDVKWRGTSALELTFKDGAGQLGNQLLYRDDEPRPSIAARGRLWSFEADGALLRLVSEAYRTHLARPFDPLLADVMARVKNTSVAGLQEAAVLEACAGRVRLLKSEEYSTDWNRHKDACLPT